MRAVVLPPIGAGEEGRAVIWAHGLADGAELRLGQSSAGLAVWVEGRRAPRFVIGYRPSADMGGPVVAGYEIGGEG